MEEDMKYTFTSHSHHTQVGKAVYFNNYDDIKAKTEEKYLPQMEKFFRYSTLVFTELDYELLRKSKQSECYRNNQQYQDVYKQYGWLPVSDVMYEEILDEVLERSRRDMKTWESIESKKNMFDWQPIESYLDMTKTMIEQIEMIVFATSEKSDSEVIAEMS